MMRKMAFLSLVLAAQVCLSQAPAAAPAGSTALCNDGTYSKSTNKLTACVGHKGNKTWYGAATAAKAGTPTPTAVPAKTAAPVVAGQAKPATPAATPKAAPVAASSSDIANAKAKGLVWVNLNTKVYHMSSASQYGATKNGKFMTEADAKAAGYRAAKDAPAKGASK